MGLTLNRLALALLMTFARLIMIHFIKDDD